MARPVENGSTLGAHQADPARWVATVIDRCLGTRLLVPTGSEKVQGEADLADRSHLVVHLGRDRLFGTAHEFDVQGRLRRHRKLKTTVVDVDSSPATRTEAVGLTKTSGQGLLVPLRACAHQAQVGGKLGSVAKPALKGLADAAGASGCALHPGPFLERGAMPDVLIVAARELGDQVVFSVVVVAGDRSRHCPQPTGASSSSASAGTAWDEPGHGHGSPGPSAATRREVVRQNSMRLGVGG